MSMLFKRIKDWATSITSFRTGDVIPVDGPNGTAKITFSNLVAFVHNAWAAFVNALTTKAAFANGDKIPVVNGTTAAATEVETIVRNSLSNITFYRHDNQFLTSSDTLQEYPYGYSLITKRISTNPGDKFLYKGVGRGDAVSVIFFGENGSVLSSTQYSATSDYVEIEIPSDCYFVRFASIFFSDDRGKEIFEVVVKDSSIHRIEKNKDYSEIKFSKVDGYLKEDGTIYQSGDYMTYSSLVSNLIPAKAGDKFLYKGVGRGDAVSVLFYNNSGGSIIGVLKIISSDTYTEVVCPEGTYYVKFSSYAKKPFPIVASVVKPGSELLQIDKGLEVLKGDLSNKYSLPIAFTQHDGGFFRDDGSFYEDLRFNSLISDYVPVKEGDVFSYRGDGHSWAYSVIYYSAFYGVVSAYQVKSTDKFSDIIVPKGAFFARFTSFAPVGDNIQLDVYKKNSVLNKIYDNIINPLIGKKMGCLGDSLTYGHTLSQDKVWVALIGKRNFMQYYNYGINGNPIASTSTIKGMAERYVDMVDGLEYVTVMGGANDWNLNIPIGTNNDNTAYTFKGALNVLIDGLRTKYPAAHICFMTNFKRYATEGEKDYVDAMVEVCRLKAIPCRNNYEDSGIDFTDASQSSVFDLGIVDGTGANRHFSEQGNEFISWGIEYFLKSH